MFNVLSFNFDFSHGVFFGRLYNLSQIEFGLKWWKFTIIPSLNIMEILFGLCLF